MTKNAIVVDCDQEVGQKKQRDRQRCATPKTMVSTSLNNVGAKPTGGLTAADRLFHSTSLQ